MDDVRSTDYAARAGIGVKANTATLLGQVMFLVAIALAFLVVGAYVGKDLAQGTARILFFVGVGALFVSGFAGQRLRVGPLAIGWLYGTALLLGLGLGPVLAYFVTAEPSVITQAAGSTALIVAGMGAVGFVLSKDLSSWMRPLGFVMLAAVVVSYGLAIFSTGGNPVISIIIGALASVTILVDFNYLRKKGTEADAVWLATGIFVSILNIFISALNLFR